MTFSIKSGDTSPALRANLRYDDCSTVNLTGATVRFHMRQFGSTEVLIDAEADVVSVGGVVEYWWDSGDTDVIGSYEAEFEVTYSDGKVEKFPSDGFISVEIVGAIA